MSALLLQIPESGFYVVYVLRAEMGASSTAGSLIAGAVERIVNSRRSAPRKIVQRPDQRTLETELKRSYRHVALSDPVQMDNIRREHLYLTLSIPVGNQLIEK